MDLSTRHLRGVTVLTSLVLAGCITDVSAPPLPADHPANPVAPAAPFVRPDPWSTDGPLAGRSSTATAATTFTCPMHPEIVSNRPGSCPICHMTLVERVADSDTMHHDGEPHR